MRYKLGNKLSITYAIIAVVTVGMIAALFNLFVEKYFIEYVKANNETMIHTITHSIEHQYHNVDKWDKNKLRAISDDALKEGLILVIKDKEGRVIWDTSKNKGMSDELLLSYIENNMRRRYKNWNGKIEKKEVPLYYEGEELGSAVIKYYGPFYFTENEFDYINVRSRIIRLVMMVSISLSVLLGIIISRQISVPIEKAIRITKLISEGNYKTKIDIKSNAVEIDELVKAVNLLGEKLEKQNTMRKRIVSDIAHELRTPLAAIQSYLETLIEGVWEPTIDKLNNIYREVLRVNRLVGDLSKLTRYESETDNLNIQLLDLDEVISRIIMNFSSEIHKKDIRLKVDTNVKSIYADEDKISQVIVNILSNSIKYTDTGGEITITTYENNSKVFIKVKDNGIGIPPEDLPHVFERFYRVDKSRQRNTGGSGIGLTITKAIVEAHRGNIRIES
ncbi:sensor histidine kinase [Fonticella tunisiensis]|uniref:histidine kinase n=1 Tax=Fonticella tunisiensis TaxID=1096341 RepID=A0A4R7KV56_9CLOT|nr:ATP-binding protein [Fonticella tunisiensis]TDT63644.1 signal transduction histidine kinase [Fonticella tunisiensis]